MHLRAWLAKGEADLLAGPHPDRARLDAERLLLHAIGKDRAWLLTHLDVEFGGCGSIGYAALIQRRLTGEPIQYIVGEVEFYGLAFRVTRDVLIPRPETEHLVEKCLQICRNLHRPRLLDVGTGSGAIPVALATHLPDAIVTSVDISDAALAIARENASRNDAKIRFLQGDLLAPVAGETFDLIVSNPPYVPETDKDSLSVEVRDFEPALALFAGTDGLAIYRRLIPVAFASLARGGHIVLEIGHGQSEAVHALLSQAGFRNIEFTPDLQGISRVASAQRA